MPNRGRVRKLRVTGYTSKGFLSFAQKTLSNVEHLFVLRGGSSQGKTAILERVCERLVRRGSDVEVLHCPLDIALLEGLVAPALGTAIVDGPACLMEETRGQGMEIDLGPYCDQQGLRARLADIESTRAEMASHLEQATTYLQQAKQIHEQVEDHYVQGLDFAKADAKAETLIEEIFAGRDRVSKKPQVRAFFAVSVSGAGSVDDLRLQATDSCRRRYILKGRPGTGKSTLAKKIAAAANERGYDTELYVCGFDPDSLDGATIPALSVTVLDGTPIHTLEPERPGDETLDMLECVDLEQVDLDAIRSLQKRSQEYSIKSNRFGAAAREAWARLESLYAGVMDDAATEPVAQTIVDRIATI